MLKEALSFNLPSLMTTVCGAPFTVDGVILTLFLLFILSLNVGTLASNASNMTGVWLGTSLVSWATPLTGIT